MLGLTIFIYRSEITIFQMILYYSIWWSHLGKFNIWIFLIWFKTWRFWRNSRFFLWYPKIKYHKFFCQISGVWLKFSRYMSFLIIFHINPYSGMSFYFLLISWTKLSIRNLIIQCGVSNRKDFVGEELFATWIFIITIYCFYISILVPSHLTRTTNKYEI